jgi:hypothetical protein
VSEHGLSPRGIAKLFGVPVGKGGIVKAKDAEGKPIEITRNATDARWTFVIGQDGRVRRRPEIAFGSTSFVWRLMSRSVLR